MAPFQVWFPPALNPAARPFTPKIEPYSQPAAYRPFVQNGVSASSMVRGRSNINKLKTCRYWAFGTHCPNINQRTSMDDCPFAHWDTGFLSSITEQRGTCIDWLRHGFCLRLAHCMYEHRDTGYTGLYQGKIELSGLNLQVADAASSAGFDTTNHEALFNLIWAVRRIAFDRGCATRNSNTQPPPKHPIYPDRWRPSGIGDNTRRKRKFQEEIEPKKENDKPREILPAPRSRDVGVGGGGGKGSQEDPIALDSDNEIKPEVRQGVGENAGPAKKKHKIGRNKGIARGRNNPATVNTRPVQSASVQIRPRTSARSAAALPTTTNPTSRTAYDLIFNHTPPPPPKSTSSHQARVPSPTLQTSIGTILTTLSTATQTFTTAQTQLYDLFDAHAALQAPALEPNLQALSKALHSAQAEAATAVGRVENVLGFFRWREGVGVRDSDEIGEIE